MYAQCYAALMLEYAQIKNYVRVLGIDIGGFTADYMMLVKGKIDISATDSLENGVIRFYQDVRKSCRKKYDAIVDESDVDEILSGNTDSYDLEIIEEVEHIGEKFVDQLLATFRELGIDLKSSFVVFMGGGSMLLKKFIEKSPLLKKFTFIDQINANAKGYEFLYQVYQRKLK